MFAYFAHPGSRLSERGEGREGVEAVDDRLRRRAIEAAGRVERVDACGSGSDVIRGMGAHTAGRAEGRMPADGAE